MVIHQADMATHFQLLLQKVPLKMGSHWSRVGHVSCGGTS